MHHSVRTILLSSCTVFTLGFAPAAMADADVAYINGKIYTVDSDNPWAEAVAIDGERFVAVGSDREIRKHIGENTRVVDLRGGFSMPGMYDLHTHIDLLLEPKYTDGIQTLPLGPDDMKAAILEFAESHPGDGWIFGGTYDPGVFETEGVAPGKAYLDAFIPDRPVAILDTSRHMMMVNSKALEVGGINKNTFVQEHAVIPLDDDGELVGLLVDGAQSYISHVLPLADEAKMTEIYAEGQALLNEYGVIGTRSQHVNTVRLRAVQELEQQGRITARFDMATSWKNDLYVKVPDRAAFMTGERHRYRSRHVNANMVKMHVDGQPMGSTSYFLDDYKGRPGYRGKLNESPEELIDMTIDLDRRGIGIQFHVLGDASTRLVLDAIEAARKANGPNGPRHMLAHTAFIHSDDAHRVKELGIVAEYTYTYLGEIFPLVEFSLEQRAPDSAAPSFMNIKPVLESGGVAVWGSDLVVASTPDPFGAFQKATERRDRWESISIEDAIKMATINGAYAMGIEEEAGSISVGKYADMIVLDGNPLELTGDALAGISVTTTLFEGKEVYKR